MRCLNIGLDSGKDPHNSHTLDTSPNAHFHQCCLVWQHPALPWIELFPRSAARLSSGASSIILSSQNLKDSLQREWRESFRSLFQVRRYCHLCNRVNASLKFLFTFFYDLLFAVQLHRFVLTQNL